MQRSMRTFSIAMHTSFIMQQMDDLETPKRWPSMWYSVTVDKNQTGMGNLSLTGMAWRNRISFSLCTLSIHYIGIQRFLLSTWNSHTSQFDWMFCSQCRKSELLSFTKIDFSMCSWDVKVDASNSNKWDVVRQDIIHVVVIETSWSH